MQEQKWHVSRRDNGKRFGWAFTNGRQLFIARTDTRSGKVIRHARWHDYNIVALAFNADGRQLVAVDAGGDIRLWDVASGRELHTSSAGKPLRNVKGGIFTPDGHRLILVEHDGQVHLWDVRTGKLIRSLQQPLEEPPAGDEETRMALALSPGGERLFVAYLGRLRVWDLRAGREERFEPADENPNSKPCNRPVLSLSPDGQYLARVEHRLLLYEVKSGLILHRFSGACTAACFHPTRPRLAVANAQRLDAIVLDLGVLFRAQRYTGQLALRELWANLADKDGWWAHRAVWRLAATPGMEAFLAEKLTPGGRFDAEQINKHTAELAGDFATRQRAEQRLAAAADAARPALLHAQRNTVDLEQRLRLERLLARLALRSPEQLRLSRAIIALEGCGSRAARHLLNQLSRQLPRSRLTDEAKAALTRLNRQRAEP